MAKPETTACWWQQYTGPNNGKWFGGKFHQWGSETNEYGAYTVGIVEDEETGQIVTPMPSGVSFHSQPPADKR